MESEGGRPDDVTPAATDRTTQDAAVQAIKARLGITSPGDDEQGQGSTVGADRADEDTGASVPTTPTQATMPGSPPMPPGPATSDLPTTPDRPILSSRPTSSEQTATPDETATSDRSEIPEAPSVSEAPAAPEFVAEPAMPTIAAAVVGPLDHGTVELPEPDAGQANLEAETPAESSMFDTPATPQGQLSDLPGNQDRPNQGAFSDDSAGASGIDEALYQQAGLDQPSDQAFGFEEPDYIAAPEQSFGHQEQSSHNAKTQTLPTQADVTQVGHVPLRPLSAHQPGPLQPILAPAAQPRSPSRKAGKAGVLTALVGPLVVLGAALLTWWLLTRGADPIVSQDHLGTPSQALDAFQDLSNQQSFWDSITLTLSRIGVALAGGAIGGVGLGWLTGRYILVRNLLRPVVSFFRLLSPILALPFFILWWGSNGVSVWLPALIGMTAVVTWTMSNAIDDRERRMAHNIGERVMLALRTGLAVAWPLLFASEMMAAEDGIGPQLLAQHDASNLDQMAVWLVVAAVAALTVDLLLRLVQYLLARRARRELI